MARQHSWLMKVSTFALAIQLSIAFAGDTEKPASSDEEKPKYTLRYQFEKDEVLNYQVDQKTTLITSKPQYVEKVSQDVESKKNHRVVAVDSSGVATLELAIEHTKMSAQFGEAPPKTFDSKHPQDCPPVYKNIKDMIGKPLARVQVTPRGVLLRSTPLLPGELLAKANMLQAAGAGQNDPSQNFLIEFPEHAIAVGEGWTNTFQVKVNVSRLLSQSVTLQRRYELVGVKDNIATLKLNTGLITPTRDGMILAQLIQMTPKGVMEFDLEHGRLVSRTLTIDKTEVGVIGGDSSMQAKSKRTERWLDPAAEQQAGG